MFVLFTSLVAILTGLAMFLSVIIHGQLVSPSSDYSIDAAAQLELDRQEEGFELAMAGFIPYTLVMIEEDDTYIFRPARLHVDAEANYLAVHKSWIESTPKTYEDFYWFMPDVNHAVSVNDTYGWTGGNFSEVDVAPVEVNYLFGGWAFRGPANMSTEQKQARIDLMHTDLEQRLALETKACAVCLTCNAEHSKQGECFCSPVCEAGFGTQRERLAELTF